MFLFPGFPQCCFNMAKNKSKYTSLPLSATAEEMRTLIRQWFPELENRTFVLCKMTSNTTKKLQVMDWGTPKKILESQFKGVIFIKSGLEGK